MKEDGTIEGKPSQAGTFNAKIEITASKTTAGAYASMGSSTETDVNTFDITIVVSGADGEIVDTVDTWTENVPYISNGNWYVNGQDTGVSATNDAAVKSNSTPALIFAIISFVGVLALGGCQVFKKKK